MSSPRRLQDEQRAGPGANALGAGGAIAGAATSHAQSPVDPETAQAKELLGRAIHGDRAAYGKIIVMYQDRVFNAVLRMIGDREEAAELTQEAFARGLSAVGSFRGDAAPYTWLFRIAMNLTISRLRQVKRHRVFSLSQASRNGHGSHGNDQAASLLDRAAKSAAQPGDAMEQRERAEQVVAALGRIDEDYRAVLVMRDVEGFDYQQMAQVLELPLGTLKSRLFRARIALRDQLKNYIGEWKK